MNYMNGAQKIDAIKGLVNLAFDHPQMEEELLGLIRKVVGPEPELVPVARFTEPTASELILARHNKIQAIKAHRARTGLGIKESKEAIDNAGIKLGFYDELGRYRNGF